MPDARTPRPPAGGGDALDDRLRTLAHALVADAPEPPALRGAEPTAVAGTGAGGRRRAGRPGRPGRTGRAPRPLVLAAVAAVVAAAVGTVAVLAGAGDDDAPPTAFVAGLGPDAPGPQRLALEPHGRELLPDGTLVDLPDAGLDHPEAVWMPDGRTIALGVEDATPRPGLTDDDVPYLLRVAAPDGTVLVERRWEGGDRPARLLGATEDTAILLRDGDPPLGEEPDPADERIVTHDLATGEERVVGATGIPFAQAEAYGDRVVTAGPDAFHGGPNAADGGCRVEVVSLVDGTSTAHPLPRRCQEVRAIRLSPDGTRAAVVYGLSHAPPANPEVWVAVVDLTTSTVVADELLGNDLHCDDPAACPGVTPRGYLGMAWDDDATLRLALDDLAARPERWETGVTLGPDLEMPDSLPPPRETLFPDVIVVEVITVR